MRLTAAGEMLHDSAELTALVAAGLGFSLIPSVVEACLLSSAIVALKFEQQTPEFPVYNAWRKGAVATR